jgi:toxin ParE1/3/4
MAAKGSIDLWSPAATQDLRDIWAWFADIASTDTADSLLRELNGTGGLIAKDPLAWRVRNDIMVGVRAVAVHPYMIFYRVEDGAPEIIRVLHERRHFAAILSDANAKM